MNYEQRAKKLTERLRTLDPLLEVRVKRVPVSFSLGENAYQTHVKRLDLYRRAEGNDYLLSTGVPLTMSLILIRANLHRANMHGREEYNYLKDINSAVAREKQRKAEAQRKEAEAELQDMAGGKSYFRI